MCSPSFACAIKEPEQSNATGVSIVGFSLAMEIGHGPQCCKSSALSLYGWRTVQSAKKDLVSPIAAASTNTEVIVPWISVSHAIGNPSSLQSAFAAHGMIPISSWSAFQHWIAPQLHPYFFPNLVIAIFNAATLSSCSGVTLMHIFSRQ